MMQNQEHEEKQENFKSLNQVKAAVDHLSTSQNDFNTRKEAADWLPVTTDFLIASSWRLIRGLLCVPYHQFFFDF